MVKDPFKVQDMVSDSPLQLTFKKPPLGEFWGSIKKNSLNYLSGNKSIPTNLCKTRFPHIYFKAKPLIKTYSMQKQI